MSDLIINDAPSGGGSGCAGTLITPTFQTGQGWTLVPSSPPGGAASFEVVGGSPVGRITLTGTSEFHGLTGPRIERKFPQGVEVWKATVRLLSRTNPSAATFLGLYLRDVSSAAVIMAAGNGSIAGMTPPWNIDGPSPAGEVSFDGTCFIALRGSRSTGHRRGSIDAAGVWYPRSTVLWFDPTHIGIIGLCDGPQSTVIDVDQFTLETFG